MRAKAKANIIHHDSNPCGGGERVSFATMQAISDMGIEFDIKTYSDPKLSKSINAYGKDLVSIIKKARKIEVVSSFNEINKKTRSI